jgi:hypothetical protein
VEQLREIDAIRERIRASGRFRRMDVDDAAERSPIGRPVTVDGMLDDWALRESRGDANGT